MTPELTALALAALLQVVQFALMAVPTNLELSPGKTLSPRDRKRLGGDIQDQVSDKTARLIRAWENHFESLALFTIAVVVVTLAEANTGFTAACAWAYLIARILYIPAYYLGLTPWRSLIWLVGFLAAPAMLIATLIPSSG
ncbi:MAPEG family protein [uncultured Tateyamaria sp.]|uniref:MAPEG family protein n=1 Tax=uncultured Tateyamaria sp. TaxID=455651 RepID=UPI0026219A93|nr:MAPEG family protein [uncultured Tateyamaria sp.]